MLKGLQEGVFGMAFAGRLRFRARLMKVGVDGVTGVTRDKATAYGYTLTGKKTAPVTDFDPFAAETMQIPIRDTVAC